MSNFTGRFGTLMEPYWFIELVAQMLVILTAMMAIGPVHRLAKANPWRFAVGFLVLACLISIATVIVWPRPELANRTPLFLLWLVGCGWALAQAKTAAQKAIVFSIVVAMVAVSAWLLSGETHAYLQRPTQIAWLIGAVALMLWVRRVVMPGFLRTALSAIAGASLQIYLVHNVVTHEFLYVLRYGNLTVIIAVSVAAGLALKMVQDMGGQCLAVNRTSTGRLSDG